MNPRLNAKDRGLIKGAIRRAFARSELHKLAMSQLKIEEDYSDPKRPRVKKWVICPACKQYTPKSYMKLDHRIPVIPVDRSFEEMSLDEVVDRVWCDIKLLDPICDTCHDGKTKAENKLRKENKKRKKSK